MNKANMLITALALISPSIDERNFYNIPKIPKSYWTHDDDRLQKAIAKRSKKQEKRRGK